MRTRVALLLAACAIALSLALTPVSAQAASAVGKLTGTPAIEEAKCAVVTNATGEVLWSKNESERMAPASITKVMTAMCALDANIPMSEKVTITGQEYEADAQLAGYKAGDTTTFGELMQVMLVYSANDAAYEIAVKVAGSQAKFADLMNAKASEIGMTNSHFMNPHGLEEDNHYSTAADLAIMGRHALSNYPVIAKLVHTPSVTVNVGGEAKSFNSTDHLMEYYDGLLGIKTGAVASGQTFLGAAERYGVRLYSCVLGCETSQGRFDDTAIMFDWVFDQLVNVDVANRTWIVGYVQDMFHFGWYYPVRASADFTVHMAPYEPVATYTRKMTSPRILGQRGEVRGTHAWMQSARLIGSVQYKTDVRPARHVCFGTFTSQLWGDGLPLGY